MLTDTKLRNLKPQDKLYKVNDRDGLYVAVTPAVRQLQVRGPRHRAVRTLRRRRPERTDRPAADQADRNAEQRGFQRAGLIVLLFLPRKTQTTRKCFVLLVAALAGNNVPDCLA